jgi:hypothetical protein
MTDVTVNLEQAGASQVPAPFDDVVLPKNQTFNLLTESGDYILSENDNRMKLEIAPNA